MEAAQTPLPPVVLVVRAVIWLNGRILLLRRSMADSFCPGCWELPGRKINQGENMNMAIEREVKNKTNLIVTPGAPLYHYDHILLPGTKYAGSLYLALFCRCQLESLPDHLRLDSAEHCESRWCTEDEALKLPLTTEGTKQAIMMFYQLS